MLPFTDCYRPNGYLFKSEFKKSWMDFSLLKPVIISVIAFRMHQTFLIFIVRWIFHLLDVLELSIMSQKYDLVFSRYSLINSGSLLSLLYSIHLSSKTPSILFCILYLGLLRGRGFSGLGVGLGVSFLGLRSVLCVRFLGLGADIGAEIDVDLLGFGAGFWASMGP